MNSRENQQKATKSFFFFFMVALSTVSQQGQYLTSWLIFKSEGWQRVVPAAGGTQPAAGSPRSQHGLGGGSGSRALLEDDAAEYFNVADSHRSHEC